MLEFLLLAAAAAEAASSPQATPSKPRADARAPIVIQGKPQMVCTETRLTGSRVRRGKICRTVQQVEEDRQNSARSFDEAAREQMVREAIACGPPSIKMCN